MDVLTLFLILVSLHFLGDYPLQGDFLSRAKNRTNPIQGVPWYQALAAHSGIQAFFVGFATGSYTLALAEFIIHFITDDLKCTNRISYNMDQVIHIGCKLLWAIIVVVIWGQLPHV